MRFAEFDQGADEYNVKICNKCRDFLCTRASQSRSFVVLGSGRGGGGGEREREREREPDIIRGTQATARRCFWVCLQKHAVSTSESCAIYMLQIGSQYDREHPFTDNSRRSQSKKHFRAGAGRPRLKKPHIKKSQAHTTNGTRARGRWETGEKLRPRTGLVLEISEVVRRHKAQPDTANS